MLSKLIQQPNPSLKKAAQNDIISIYFSFIAFKEGNYKLNNF